MGLFDQLTKEEIKQKEMLENKETKKQGNKEENEETKKQSENEVKKQTKILINFQDTKQGENLVRYSTYLPPSLIKKIKVDSAISNQDQQVIIRKILETHYNDKF